MGATPGGPTGLKFAPASSKIKRKFIVKIGAGPEEQSKMLKIIRQRPWVVRILMIIISVTFVITMGWWGFESSTTQANRMVAQVGETVIGLEEYQALYDRTERFYRDLFKERYNEETARMLDLKNSVINDMIERRLWLMAARELDVKVTDRELSDFILEQEAFYRNGRFDPEQYRQVLKRNRLTPERYEALQREDLLVEKVQAFIKASVALTDAERQQALATQVASEATETPDDQSALRGVLLRKQQMALESYLNDVKTRVPVTINDKML